MQRGEGPGRRAPIWIAELAAHAHDAIGHLEHVLGRRTAEQHDDIGRDQLDLALEERPADLRLLRGGRRLPGGRQYTMLVMWTSSSLSWMAASILSSS